MPRHPLRAATAISGLGITEVGKVYRRSAADFAIDAVHRALTDAGLAKRELDGLLLSAGITPGVDLHLASQLGLPELRLLTQMNGFGSTATQMVQYAAMAVASGMANHVACVFADAPLREGERSGKAYTQRGRGARGMGSLYGAYGFAGPIPFYAMAAQRHMDLYGTTQDQLGQVAISTREWATRNPLAARREPLSLEDYHASPWVVEPLHVLDCCLVSNGGVCVIVSAADRARDLARPPAYVMGMGQAHRLDGGHTAMDTDTVSPGGSAGASAFAMADAQVADVTSCQLYDCYTYTVLVTLEDYGFCSKGEGGRFVEEGHIGPDGSLPTNTGGGELSSFYLWGMTPLSEAVIQVRGDGGERQVERNDLVLATGNGGVLNFHGCVLLAPDPA